MASSSTGILSRYELMILWFLRQTGKTLGLFKYGLPEWTLDAFITVITASWIAFMGRIHGYCLPIPSLDLGPNLDMVLLWNFIIPEVPQSFRQEAVYKDHARCRVRAEP